MDGFRIPIGQWARALLDWARQNLDWLLDLIKNVVGFLANTLADILISPPALLMIVVFALIAWVFRSWQLAIGTAAMFIVILGVNQWEQSMQTLALVLVATLVTVAIAVPLGIWAARNDTVSTIIRPVLDFMQTMPSLVYLIPVIMFFSLGFVPGVVATVIFSLPPGVRLTELGIRGVDKETVEAGYAFGAKPGQILRGIQLPLATPTIMAGINQVIMLALSMAVIAGMAGAPGLGKEVVAALSTINVAQGVEAGLGVVFIAVFLDRVSAALGNLGDHPSSLLNMLGRRQAKLRGEEKAAEEEDSDVSSPVPM